MILYKKLRTLNFKQNCHYLNELCEITPSQKYLNFWKGVKSYHCPSNPSSAFLGTGTDLGVTMGCFGRLGLGIAGVVGFGVSDSSS